MDPLTIEVHLAERDKQLPQSIEKVEDRLWACEDFITTERATSKDNSVWMKWMWPLIWAAIGIAGLLVLQSAPIVLKALTR